MKNLYLAFTFLIILNSCSNSEKKIARNDTEDIASIRTLIDDYTNSVNACDTLLAKKVWESSHDASFIHPLGHDRGWNNIRDNIYMKLMNGLFYERKLSVKDVAIHTASNTGWVEFYWDFKARMRADSSEINSQGRESQVYIKKDDGWKLVHVHYSMPVKEVSQGL